MALLGRYLRKSRSSGAEALTEGPSSSHAKRRGPMAFSQSGEVSFRSSPRCLNPPARRRGCAPTLDQRQSTARSTRRPRTGFIATYRIAAIRCASSIATAANRPSNRWPRHRPRALTKLAQRRCAAPGASAGPTSFLRTLRSDGRGWASGSRSTQPSTPCAFVRPGCHSRCPGPRSRRKSARAGFLAPSRGADIPERQDRIVRRRVRFGGRDVDHRRRKLAIRRARHSPGKLGAAPSGQGLDSARAPRPRQSIFHGSRLPVQEILQLAVFRLSVLTLTEYYRGIHRPRRHPVAVRRPHPAGDRMAGRVRAGHDQEDDIASEVITE